MYSEGRILPEIKANTLEAIAESLSTSTSSISSPLSPQSPHLPDFRQNSISSEIPRTSVLDSNPEEVTQIFQESTASSISSPSSLTSSSNPLTTSPSLQESPDSLHPVTTSHKMHHPTSCPYQAPSLPQKSSLGDMTRPNSLPIITRILFKGSI